MGRYLREARGDVRIYFIGVKDGCEVFLKRDCIVFEPEGPAQLGPFACSHDAMRENHCFNLQRKYKDCNKDYCIDVFPLFK